MREVILKVILSLLLLVPLAGVKSQDYYAYPGAVHIHTRASDGSGTFEEVAQAAQAVGLSYIVVTDHNTLEHLRDGNERYWGKTLALVGMEVTTDQGHILALDVPPSFNPASTEAEVVLRRIQDAGGMAFIAHPMAKSWRWTDWSVKAYTGIEVVNLAALVDDDLRTALHAKAPRRSLGEILRLSKRYASDPDAVLRQWTERTVQPELNQWDELLSLNRQVAGIGSVDAHARIMAGNTPLKIPTYQEAFESVWTYAVTLKPLKQDLQTDRKEIYSAYRNGRLYIVYPRVAPAPDFRFSAREGEREAIMGQPLQLEREARIVVSAPGHPRPFIRLLKDGKEIAAKQGSRLEWIATAPGVYRAEVYAAPEPGGSLKEKGKAALSNLLNKRPRDMTPWIFSNPIYIKR